MSLTEMAKKIQFSKSLLGMVETGRRRASIELIEAYERVLGVDMWRKDITHSNLLVVTRASRAELLAGVERGDPGPLRTTPTAHRTDVSLGSAVSEKAAEWFRKWAVDGDTATLRTNSLSVIAKLPGRQNADLVIQVLENDPKVRRLIVASEISRLTQVGWQVALEGADDPTTIPELRKLAPKLAKGAINPRGTESRWACTYLLTRMVSVLGRAGWGQPYQKRREYAIHLGLSAEKHGRRDRRLRFRPRSSDRPRPQGDRGQAAPGARRRQPDPGRAG